MIPKTKGLALNMLKEKGLRPLTIIDVGVHKEGTPELYQAFPDAKFVLIEPVEEFEQDILKMCNEIKHAELIKIAASNKNGTSLLEIRKTAYLHAGLIDNVEQDYDKNVAREVREVEVITLDKLCREKKMSGPYMIKIDVDGRDLEVLEGSVSILAETDCVIVEATINDISIRTQFLEKHGLFLWAIVDFFYVRGVLWQVDLVFLNNKYRYDGRYRPWYDKNFSWDDRESQACG